MKILELHPHQTMINNSYIYICIPSSFGNTAAPKGEVVKKKERVEARRNGTRRNIFFFILPTQNGGIDR
jgi:hypothetical protein